MSVAPELAPRRPRRFVRELTTLVALPFAIWLVGWAPRIVYILGIAAVASLALWEFLDLGRRKGYPVQRVVSIVLMLFLLSAFPLASISVEMGVFAALLVIPACYVLTGRDLERALPGTAVSVLGILYVGMLAGSLLRLRLDFAVGAKLVYFNLIVVWAGDAGAYYIGSKFGKHPLSPMISPKKSVEGGAGGVCTAILAAIIIVSTFFPEFPMLHAVICAAILSVTGVIGDLAESMWKRSADVKDSGRLIPGHGGFLDRFDSILFTAPILYSYWWLIENHFHLKLT